jgi:FG-GAP repeat protein
VAQLRDFRRMTMSKAAKLWFFAAMLACVLSALNNSFAQSVTTRLSDLPITAQSSISAALENDTQLAKLTASDGAEDSFGVIVAISGNTVVVGAPLAKIGTNLQQGAAYVFVKPASGWKNMTQVAKLTASDGAAYDQLGRAVAISGNSVIVGAPQAVRGGYGAGAAYVFVQPKSGWTDMTETAEFSGSDEAAGSYFGGAVAISGNTALASGLNNYGMGSGAEYIFVKPASGWKSGTETAQLSASNGGVGPAAISGDTVIAGGAALDQWRGAAYVFVKPAGGWQNMTETAMLTDANGKIADDLGWSVAISGNTVLVGAIQGIKGGSDCNCGPGKVYVFVKPATGWKTGTKYTAKLTAAGTPAGFNLGYSVSLDGNTAAVGSWPAHYGSKVTEGLAYVFTKPVGGWKTTSNPNATLRPSDAVSDDDFGISVSISGNTIVSGANGAKENNSEDGAAYVFGK